MEGILMMSQKELYRIQLIEQVAREEITIIESAKVLSLSERQMYRILRRYRTEGNKGVIHRLRGRASNRGYSRSIRKQVCKLYWEQYHDYGPTLFS
ncbi:MAG: helix-turn-helix domain-containing protein, partial [Ignavibacteriales bacterium]|nr:helix-turn-helix domain-containing protein [Ignavibacteriales bacterium]